ncbi:SulP family inorganic anion transporter [Pseudomonas sp. N040]|nr:SulP family inorganic anion transporter [Pseudomonas sp. N040]
MPALLGYRRADLPHDLIAGLSVAAVALPVGVAYALLAGFSPVVGLYVSILPLFIYALFGTSRQLMVGPDAATCALVAAAVTPLAAGDAQTYLALTMLMTTLAGLMCIAASFLRLGALADFLSRPILVGFLNGISLYILAGQLGKLLGFSIDAGGILPKLLEVAGKIDHIHWPTLAVGLVTLAIYGVAKRWLPRLPAPLLALVGSGLLVALFGLDELGVAVVGTVPAGLPQLRLPSFSFEQIEMVAGPAAGLALITFTSMILTARSFAAKNHYEIDADREMAALGAANIAAAVSQGFAISGADSRTAMADASGGRTQMTGLVAAASIALVLVFLSDPLRYIPMAGLGAVLIMASLSLLDLRPLRQFYRLSRFEFALCLFATFGVIWVGAIKAIVVAVVLALLHFVHLSARPSAEILGKVKGLRGYHSVARHPTAQTDSGLLLFRFNAPLVFFNASHFKQQAQAAINAAGPSLKWFVLDTLPVTHLDITGYCTVDELARSLREQGAELVLAGRMTELMERRKSLGLEQSIISHHFPSIGHAVESYRSTQLEKS